MYICFTPTTRFESSVLLGKKEILTKCQGNWYSVVSSPRDCLKRFTIHHLADLFIPSPTQCRPCFHYCVKTSRSHIFRYSLIQLSELEQCGVHQIAQVLKRQQLGYNCRGGVVVGTLDPQLRELGFEYSCCCFEALTILFTPPCLSSLSCIDEYLAIDSGEYVNK